MGFKNFLLLAIAVAGMAYFYQQHSSPDLKAKLEDAKKSRYFGSGQAKKDDTTIKPFKIAVPESVLEDLKYRLEHARVNHSVLEDSDNFYYGFNSKQLLKLRDYWLNQYNWRKQEAIINEFPQFTTQIEGLQLHFIHAKPDAKKYKTVKPILLAHGWPGNVFEFYKMIPMLTDPKKHGINVDYAFEVVAPSIPGYGWSEQPKKTGFSQLACARLFRQLMIRLNHKKFYLQGGDWGALVTGLMAKVYPENVLALHLNMIFSNPGASMKGSFLEIFGSFFPQYVFSSKKLHDFSLFSKMKQLLVETGYMHLQATKPDTVGTSLNDSPLGLAAYIVEKFSTWTNSEYRSLPDGGLNKKFTNDELLTIVMIYWVNGNIVSSTRFYREFFLDETIDLLGKQYLFVPTAHASGLNEFFDRTPVEISKCLYNITHYTEIDMGHFAAFEQPKPVAASVFEFVSELNARN